MARCPVCERDQPRLLGAPFDCGGCGAELKMAGSTVVAMILIPVVVLVPALVLLKPWIGKAGIIITGILGGHLLPWICYVLFYRVEGTGHLDLSDARGSKRPESWTRRLRPGE